MKRNDIIDISKGIAIILMVIGHLNIDYVLKNIIYSFHMPIFIFCSGIFIKDENILVKLKKNYFLVLNYIIFGVIFSLISNLLLDYNLLENFKNIILSTPFSIWSIRFFGAYWFILSLFLIKVCVNKWIYNRLIYGFLLFIIITYCQSLKVFNFAGMFFCIGPALIMIIYYQLARYYDRLISLVKCNIKFVILILLFIIIYSFSIFRFNGFNEKIINYGIVHIFNPIIGLSLGILGIMICFGVSQRIKGQNIISQALIFVGVNSFAFFALHLFFFRIVQFISSILDIEIPIFLVIVITLLMCYIFIIIKNRLIKNKILDKILFLK